MFDQEQETRPGTGALVKHEPQQAMISIAQQREMAEIQSMMIIARANPRNQQASIDRIVDACTRPKLAEAATYEYARGGTEITGPSIRLAETMAQNWGNLAFGVKELEQRDGESTVEAFCWDLETNVRQSKVFQVAHSRKAGGKIVQLSDPRDIYELVANQGARRVRACILGIIPGDVQDRALEQCEATLRAHAEVTPERLKNLLSAFAKFGVTKEQIETRIQRRLDTMSPAQLLNLAKIHNSLRDGMSTPADWFKEATSSGPVAIDPAKIRLAAEENRGHGNEGLSGLAPAVSSDAGRDQGREAPESLASQPASPAGEAIKPKAPRQRQAPEAAQVSVDDKVGMDAAKKRLQEIAKQRAAAKPPEDVIRHPDYAETEPDPTEFLNNQSLFE